MKYCVQFCRYPTQNLYDTSAPRSDLIFISWSWSEFKFWLSLLGQHAYASMRLDAENAMEAKTFRYLRSKVIREKRFRHGHFDLPWSLEPNALQVCQSWLMPGKRTVKKLSSTFLRPPSYNSFWIDCTFAKKHDIHLNLTFDDFWLHKYWPERKNDPSCFDYNPYRLSEAVYRISLSLLVSEMEVGFEINPSPAIMRVLQEGAPRRRLKAGGKKKHSRSPNQWACSISSSSFGSSSYSHCRNIAGDSLKWSLEPVRAI